MKNYLFIAALFFVNIANAQVNNPQCLSVFQDAAVESQVFSITTSSRLKAIEPTTRDLELYDGGNKKKVDVGDYISVEFIEPIAKDNPTTTSTIEGYMLGTRQLIDPSTGQLTTYYFVMNAEQTKSGRHIIMGFKLDNVDPFLSTVRKDLSYKSKDLSN